MATETKPVLKFAGKSYLLEVRVGRQLVDRRDLKVYLTKNQKVEMTGMAFDHETLLTLLYNLARFDVDQDCANVNVVPYPLEFNVGNRLIVITSPLPIVNSDDESYDIDVITQGLDECYSSSGNFWQIMNTLVEYYG